jgi:hypothetical protein
MVSHNRGLIFDSSSSAGFARSAFRIGSGQREGRDFHVKIDTSTAVEWRTVGDVYNALLLVLPDYVQAQPTTWRRFCRALCQVTGDDPEAIGRDTILIVRPWGVIAGIKRLFGR